MSSNESGKSYLLSLETKGIKLGLNRTKKLLKSLKNPEKNISSIQIIGTNGKGSTAASLSSILQEHGLNVGLFTSPHLVNLNERIQINRKQINNEYIDYFITQNQSNIETIGCTFFETLTAMAIVYFNINKVDIAILETGLGGKYDSVTACDPMLQLYTSISLDHMHILGNTIEEITIQKASAMQSGVPCISVHQKKHIKKILSDYAQENKTTIEYIRKSPESFKHLSIGGTHQSDNINLAIKASKDIYSVSENKINRGLKKIFWPGRVQLINKTPNVIFDVAHNDDSLIALCESIKSFKNEGRNILLISIQRTKFFHNALYILKDTFDTIICTSLNDRMYPTLELYNLFYPAQDLSCNDNANTSIKTAMNMSEKNDLVVIAGSHYWGELRGNCIQGKFFCKYYANDWLR